ncbi:MAG: Asp-tRNA(Asn)/Glu-tRNA(Gln) amidotransferase subunit GatA [Candidatus Aenigmarchaeota archaeon]|nr:Asp-tRNA(Asn)/Glu-tRNA(Gln) amidotransferase subunit GatA [Candidatus Aenigmarchaeota archaeon]
MKLEKLSVKEFLARIKSGDIDLDDFTAHVMENSKSIQKKYNPFITLVDKIQKPKKKGKLYGLPISIKDNICTKGIQTTAGSRILEGYTPPFSASCVENIVNEGAFILGKTAMDEFGFGTFSVNCAYGIPKNPLDTERSCGGSSGGASCFTAVADFPHVALAESTGGSISCPAAFTGTVGLTPTYGLVSRWGLIDYANSLDKIGLITKSVYDIALSLSIIAGNDSKDSTSLNVPAHDYTKYLKKDIKGMKIGVPKEYFEGVDGKITKVIWNAIKKLEDLGATYKEVSLPHTKYSLSAYYIIAVSEASTNLAKYAGMRYGLHLELKGNFDEYFSAVRSNGFGEEAKRRIILGTFARMAGYRDAYYLKALKVRTKIIEDFKKAFKQFDVLAAPTMPVVAPRFDEIEKLSPIENYMMDVLTVAPNLAGIPMISVPAGKVNNMPVGLHLMGDHLQEGKILQVANSFKIQKY